MQTAIHIQDFRGDRVVEDRDDLLRVLAQRYSNDANLFTLSSASLEYPWLNAYVRKEQSVLYYLPSEGEMFASAGELECDEEVMKFYDNETSVNWLPASHVIPWSNALACIEMFCEDFGLPNVVEWHRLS